MPSGSAEPRGWWTRLETIVENGYNLAVRRYKLQGADSAPEEDPDKLIHEVLTIAREIMDNLEKLLKEVDA